MAEDSGRPETTPGQFTGDCRYRWNARKLLANRGGKRSRSATDFCQQVPYFRKNKSFHGQTYGRRRSRHGQQQRLIHDTSKSTAEHGGGPDFLEAEVAKQFAVPRQWPGKQFHDGFVGLISPADARATRHQNRIHVVCFDKPHDLIGDWDRIVGQDISCNDAVARGNRQLDDRIASAVGFDGATIAHRNDCKRDALRCMAAMLRDRITHGGSSLGSEARNGLAAGREAQGLIWNRPGRDGKKRDFCCNSTSKKRIIVCRD